MKSWIFQAAFIGILSISCCTAVFWDDLRITSGTDLSIAFQRLARTTTQAAVANWTSDGTLEECDTGAFKGIRYVDPKDDSVALLFDRNGIIAGIQAQIPQKEILKPGNTFKFDQVPMFQNITIRGEEFFILTAYFVNPFTICTEGRTEADLTTSGTGTGLWFQNGPTANFLIEVPLDRSAGWAKGWSNNKCWRAMGMHNFWQTEKYEEHECNEIRPTFVLFNETDDSMLGFGFTIPGSVSLPRYESPPNEVISAIINPTPPCLTAMNTRVGAATLHIYFVDNPWLIACAE